MEALEQALAATVGVANVLVDADVRSGYEVDWTRRFGGPCRCVVRPASTAEVAAVVRACADAGAALVPQGGNTGLVGGGVPGAAGPAPVVLSTTRLTSIGAVDPIGRLLLVGAGVTLAAAQAAARADGFDVGVDLAARETATIGGMVATNAGGIHVLRHGTMRAQVAGLEAVLADGQVVSRLEGLVKDNSGFDLSGLLCGSEGTLGIITAVLLRLVPIPPARVTALLGLGTTEEAQAVLERLRQGLEGLEAAEVVYADGVALAASALGLPAIVQAPVVLVIEAGGPDGEALVGSVAAVLDRCPEVLDSAVADEPAGRSRLWAARERHADAVATLGIPHKLDVSIPLAGIAAFEREVRALVADVAPGSTSVIWGHLGDGNLHVNVVGPTPDDEAVDDAVLRLVAAHGGSISAEHGIGRAKTAWLPLTRSAADRAAMRAIKRALDPDGLLNPGVLFR